MSEIWTVRRAMLWTAERFARAGLASPRLDAEVLLAHVLGSDRIGVYLAYDKPMVAAELAAYRGFIQRRLAGEPVAYLVGWREFWSLPLRVDRRVLIPRPESETLVEVALDILAEAGGAETATADGLRVADVGTGSGALAIAIAKECSRAEVVAVDCSLAALEVAAANVARLGVRVDLRHGDLTAPLRETRFDLVLSNPPYVAAADVLPVDVADFEPSIALRAGPTGLEVIARLVAEAPDVLLPHGALALEVGRGQAAAVASLFEGDGRYQGANLRRDLGGVERVVWARRAPACVP